MAKIESMKAPTKTRSYEPRTLLRAVELLNCFTSEKPEMTSGEIARALNIAPSTIYRYLAAMEKEEYLMRVEGTNRYAIGLRIVALSSIALSRFNIRLLGEQVLKSLSAAVNSSANLGVIHRGSVLHVAFSPVDEFDKHYSIVGRMSALTCTAMGKVLLASLTDGEVRRIIDKYGFVKSTPKSITDMEALEAELSGARENGYAVDREEKSLGRYCIAAPVYQQGGKVVAAMSVAIATKEKFTAQFDSTLHSLCEHAGLLSTQLGYYRMNFR